MRLLPLLALALVPLLMLPSASGQFPPSTPCVRKVLTVDVVVGCRGSDGRTDAWCWYVVSVRPTTEMVCFDANANGDICLVAYYGATWDPFHRSGSVPACIPGSV